MLLNRWEKIEQVFNEALIVPVNERDSFVKQVCGADNDLCFEVISLLEADNCSDEILDQSIFPFVAEIIDQDDFSQLLEKSDFASYKLKRLLGRGGMGTVFLAEDMRLERFVALKILSSSIFVNNSQTALHFEREAKIASSVSHQNVAHIYEFGKYDGMYFFAMEYIPGKTLRELIDQKQIEILTVVDIALQIARALEAAHSKQIVHRDIKPENIMLRQRAIVTDEVLIKVLDFGIAKSNEIKSPENNISYEFVPDLIIGTIAYMSPEQVRGEAVDKRTDIWSLGVVLYELLTGIHPFKGIANSDTVTAILEKNPLPPKSLNPSISAELERITLKMLQKDREARYQTANELHIKLQKLRKSLDVKINQSPQKQNIKNFFVEKKSYQNVLYIGLIVLLFLACGYKLWNLNGEDTKQIQYQPIRSIAVLPFQIQSSNQEREYLSDGITESIINRLSQLPELSVKARSSVFQYKGKDINPQNTCEELSVQALLIGHITESGNNLTINLELIDGKTGNQIWGNQYEQKTSNIISLQNEILRDVSNHLQAKLSRADEANLSKSYTRNVEAYQLYLRGRFYWNKRTASDLQKSTEYYNQAIALDPNFALAYSGLADSYVLFSGYGAATPEESFPKAKEAAKKALEIDDTLAEAHAALGYALFNYDWNFEESEKHMKRALDLNPNYAVAHNWYGNANLLAAGQFDEAIDELKTAQKIDPFSLIINADLGNSYLFARRNDEAVEQFQKTIEMDGNFYYAHAYLGRAYMMKGLFKAASLEFEKARILGDDPRILMLMACNYSETGKKDKAKLILSQLKNMSTKRYVSAYYFALVYTTLGEKNEAFRWLEKAYQDHEGRMTLIKVDPLLDNLRSDSRFEELIKKVGLDK